MLNNIQKIFSFPKKIEIADHRFFIVGNIGYFFGATLHSLWLLLFFLIDAPFLSVFNIFSVIFLSISFLLNRYGYFFLAVTIAFTEVLIHQILCVIFIGWDAGFQHYIIATLSLPFFTSLGRTKSKFVLSFLGLFGYTAANLFLKNTDPIYHIDGTVLLLLNYSNIFFAILLIIIWAYYFSDSVAKAENAYELEKERAFVAKKETEKQIKETEELSALIKNLNQDLNIKTIMHKVHTYVKINFDIHFYILAVVDRKKEKLITVEILSPDFVTEENNNKLKSFSTGLSVLKGGHVFALKSKKPFYIKKIRKSAITSEELFVSETVKLESLLIIPLVLQNELIGFLDLFNVGQMILSKDDITRLSILGEHLAGIIYGSYLFQEVQERTVALNNTLRVIKRDLSVAKKIQQNTLVTTSFATEELKIVPVYIPMSEVGGDFYDINKINEYTYRIFLADATGHGVQAAMIMMAIKGIYDHIKNYELDVSLILAIFNKEFIKRYISLNSFMTALLIDINIRDRKIRFTSGGHPACVLLRENKIILLEKTGPLVGVDKDKEYKSGEADFGPGDRLYIFTDGIFEEFNSVFEEFGEERLHSILSINSNLTLEESVAEILSKLNQFLLGEKKQDDITILGIEYQQ